MPDAEIDQRLLHANTIDDETWAIKVGCVEATDVEWIHPLSYVRYCELNGHNWYDLNGNIDTAQCNVRAPEDDM